MKKVSLKSSVKSQVPKFVLEDHPIFIKFMEYYYEYLEEKGVSVDYIRNSLSLIDSDETFQEFLDDLFEEISEVPKAIAVDKRLLSKHVYELYKTKGTVPGIRLLFKILYGEDVEIYFPKLDVLRVSDGKWRRDLYVRTRTPIDPNAIIGKIIVQKNETSFASAFVETIFSETLDGITFYNIFLRPDSIIGTFSLEKKIELEDGSIDFAIEPTIRIKRFRNKGSYYSSADPVLTYASDAKQNDIFVNGIKGSSVKEVLILDGGSGYSVGDELQVDHLENNGANFSAVVSAVNNGAVTEVTITNAGQGYITPPVITSPGKFLPIGEDIGGVASIEIRDPGYDNDSSPFLYSRTRAYTTDIEGGVFENDEPFTIQPSSLLNENFYSFLTEEGDLILSEDQTIPEVNGTVSRFGDQVNFIEFNVLPYRIDIVSQLGDFLVTEDNGRIVAENTAPNLSRFTVIGSISGAKARVLSYNPFDFETEITAITVANKKFEGVDGKVSEFSKRIQDSRFYQEFSYVIKSSKTFESYKNALLKLSHPAGLAVFGSLKIEQAFELKIKLALDAIDHFRREIRIYVDQKVKSVSSNLARKIEVGKAIMGPMPRSIDRWKFLQEYYLSGDYGDFDMTDIYEYPELNRGRIKVNDQNELLKIDDQGNYLVTSNEEIINDEGVIYPYRRYRLTRFPSSEVRYRETMFIFLESNSKSTSIVTANVRLSKGLVSSSTAISNFNSAMRIKFELTQHFNSQSSFNSNITIINAINASVNNSSEFNSALKTDKPIASNMTVESNSMVEPATTLIIDFTENNFQST